MRIVLILLLFLGCTKVIEVEPIQEVVNYSGSQLEDWSILEELQCEWLILTSSNIKSEDLGYLKSIRGLKKLSLDNCDDIEHFDSINGLPIEWLDVDSCDGVDSFPFKNIIPLLQWYLIMLIIR